MAPILKHLSTAGAMEETDFSQVNQALHSTTFLTYGGKGQFSYRCLSSDHMQEECALHPNSLVPVVRFKDQARSGRRDERQHQELRSSWKGPCYA